jgi:hypothetical protein
LQQHSADVDIDDPLFYGSETIGDMLLVEFLNEKSTLSAFNINTT